MQFEALIIKSDDDMVGWRVYVEANDVDEAWDKVHDVRPKGFFTAWCHPRPDAGPVSVSLPRITDEGTAVVESGLTMRQAHELKTGCSGAEPCDECSRYFGEPL